ncbi:MAG: MBL fold metallo-hydrolase [Eudoraea sp.]
MKKIILFIFSIALLTLSCKDNKKPIENAKTEEVTDNLNAVVETNEVEIIPVEHATAIIEYGELTIYIDPVGGAAAFEGQKNPDLILITDIHGDHLSVETLEELNTEKAKIIVPQAVADKIPASFTPQLDILNNGEEKERFGIVIEAIPMYNLREEAKSFHEKGRGNGYVLNINGERLYFSGDTEDIPEMRSLENIDKAFICMNLPYTMTVESAASAVLEFKPAQVYPYHYRGRPDVSDVQLFEELVTKGDGDIEVVRLDWYPKESY